MRKIILSMNITKDGFIAGPDGELDWHFPYWNHEMNEALSRLLSNADTILLGRNTYNVFSGYWTMNGTHLSMAREDLILAEMLNVYTKVVVSKKSSSLPWKNSCLMNGDILGETRKLKQKQGKDIVVLGSSQLASYLIKHNLIDEYYLWVHPIVIGQGKRLSELANFLSNLKPLHVENFGTGVVKLVFCFTVGTKE